MKHLEPTNDTYAFIEKATQKLSEMSNQPLSEDDFELLGQIKNMVTNNANTKGLYEGILRAKNYEEEVESHNRVFEGTPHLGIHPKLKLQDKLKNKRYCDILLAMKVCNEAVMKKSMVVDQNKMFSEREIRQSSIVPLSQPMPFQANLDPHYNFNYALPFRWFVWSLKQLKLPTPSKFTDFEKMYPSVNNADHHLLIQKVQDATHTFLLDSPLFNTYHTESVMNAYVLLLHHFYGRKLGDLSDDEFNALSGAMYGYASICASDMFFFTLTAGLAPEFITLAQDYLRTKSMRNTFLKIGQNADIRSLYIDLVAIARAIGSRYQHFIENTFDDEPEEFIDWVLSISDLFNLMKSTLSHPANIVGQLNVFGTEIKLGPIIENIGKLAELSRLFDGIKISSEMATKLSEHKMSTCDLHTHLIAVLEDAKQLFSQDGFYEAVDTMTMFFEGSADNFDPELVYQEIMAALELMAKAKANSLALIEDGKHELAIEELKQMSSVEAQLEETLDALDFETSGATEYVINLINPIREAAARAKQDEDDEVATKESELDLATEPTISMKDHRYLMDKYEQNLINLDTDIETLTQKLAKTERELVAANKAKDKLLTTRSGPYNSLRNLMSGDCTLEDVFVILKEEYPHVEFSDDFYSYTAKCCYDMPQKLLKQLTILCDDYYKAIINGMPDTQARNIIGQCYRANESDTTLQNAELRAHREIAFNGEKKLFIRHLTIGSARDPRKTVQVYFDIVGTTLQLAYVGEHLPLAE